MQLSTRIQLKLIAFLVVAILFAIPIAQEIRDRSSRVLLVSQAQEQPRAEGPTISVTAGMSTVRAVIVSTDASRERGLGGRSGLSEGEGMLFFFDTEDIYPFWMKDMRFPIDIIWIAADGTIVDIWQKASPDTYPQVHTPTKKAKYVLEVYAGFAQKNNLHEGDKVRFSNDL